jgi:hypothetical protein
MPGPPFVFAPIIPLTIVKVLMIVCAPGPMADPEPIPAPKKPPLALIVPFSISNALILVVPVAFAEPAPIPESFGDVPFMSPPDIVSHSTVDDPFVAKPVPIPAPRTPIASMTPPRIARWPRADESLQAGLAPIPVPPLTAKEPFRMVIEWQLSSGEAPMPAALRPPDAESDPLADSKKVIFDWELQATAEPDSDSETRAFVPSRMTEAVLSEISKGIDAVIVAVSKITVTVDWRMETPTSENWPVPVMRRLPVIGARV